MRKVSMLSFDKVRGSAYLQARLVILAMAVLILGLSVYVLGRPADSTRFLPAVLHPGAPLLDQLRPLVTNLPSFLHVYAFILFSAAIVRPSPRKLVLICVIWVAIEIFFELLQQPSPLMHRVFRDVLGVGIYDPLDILAVVLGAIAAYWSVLIITRRSQ